MARKKKQSKERQRQKRSQERSQRHEKRKARGASAHRAPPVQAGVHGAGGLRVPATGRCLPPVHVDQHGHVVPSPEEVLGLAPGTTDEATVRAAWRQALVDRPPEQDPEAARRATAARDRLLDPERGVERVMGVLHVPDARAWGLTEADQASGETRLDAGARLLGQAALYALVEDELWEAGLEELITGRVSKPRGGGRSKQQDLF